MKIASTLVPVLLVCLTLTGCKLLEKVNPFAGKNSLPPQPYITGQQTLESLQAGVNQNSRKIRNFTTENASITIPGGWMPLHSRLTFERPKRLRIQGAASSVTSQEFDFGSNDEIFWLWARRNPGEMWFCRHDLYHMSPLRSTIPIDPDWLIEAFGIVEFKQTDQHFGPNRLNNGNWEIMSHCQTPSGQYIKRTVIDAKNGCVVLQELYTPQRELVALAEATDLQYDRTAEIYYAKKVTVQCRGMEGQMIIDLGSPKFNATTSFASTVFVMPRYEGYQAVDLSSPEMIQRSGVLMAPPPTPPSPNIPQANIQTVIR